MSSYPQNIFLVVSFQLYLCVSLVNVSLAAWTIVCIYRNQTKIMKEEQPME